MRRRVQHLLYLGIAWLLILIGVLFLISPIPIGIFLISVGLSILITTSDTVSHKIRVFREKRHKFNRQLIWVEQKLENRVNFVYAAMRKTRPSSE